MIRWLNHTVEDEPPVHPPFDLLDEPRPHESPIADLHRQLAHFFETRRQTGQAVVADPGSL